MGILSKLLRSTTYDPKHPRDPGLVALFGGGTATAAGITVTVESAMRITAVMACVRVLSETLASLPLKTYRVRPDGGKEPDRTHPLWALLHDQPNRWQTSFELREMLVGHVALRGNAYAQIVSTGGRGVAELIPLHPDRVRPFFAPDGTRAYEYQPDIGPRRILLQDEVLHIPGLGFDGLKGLDPITYAHEALGLSIATEAFGARFFANDARPGVYLQHPTLVSEAAATRLKESWEKRHRGSDNAHRVAVLEEGMTVSAIGVDPDHAQFLECVVPGTMFSMADGTRRAAEVLVAGDEVLAWDNGPVRARVAAVGSPPIKRLVRIKTARGRELTATFDHPCLIKPRLRTPGGGADTSPDQWTAMACLTPGNYVRVGLGSVENSGDMGVDRAWYLGAMVGDGYMRKLGCSFSNGDDGVLSEMRRVSRTMGGDLQPTKSRPYDYAIKTGGVGRSGSEIRTLFNESGLIGLHSDTKRVPEMVMAGGAQAWAAFLSGYLDADGSVGEATETQQPKVYWSSVCHELLEDCQHLLALLGINSAIYQIGNGGPREVMGRASDVLPSWGLYVTGAESLRKLAETLSPTHTVKRARLAAHAHLPASRYRPENWLYDCVTEVEHLGLGETVGVEIEGAHTHITNGLVTHNTRKFQIAEIARMFRIPPHMIGDLEKATFSNIEQQSLEFVTHTIRPWAVRIEQSIRRDLLTESEKRTHVVEFDVNGLLRGDIKSRYEAFATGRNWGWLSVNDIRRLENLNPIDKGDIYLQPLNMVEAGAPPTPALRAVLAATAERIVRKEVMALEKSQVDGVGIGAWAAGFYPAHARFVAQALGISEEAAQTYCAQRIHHPPDNWRQAGIDALAELMATTRT